MGNVVLCMGVLLAVGLVYLLRKQFAMAAFNLLWAVVIFLTRVELGLQSYNKTFSLLLLMILLVNVGHALSRWELPAPLRRSRPQVERTFNQPLLLGLQLFTFILLLVYACKTLMEFGLDLAAIRGGNNTFNETGVFGSLLDTIFFYGVAIPLLYTQALVLAYNLSQSIKTSKIAYVLLAANMVVQLITTGGGRNIFLRIALFFAAAFVWRMHSCGLFRGGQLKYLVLGIGMLAVLLLMMEALTAARNTTGITFFQQAVRYVRGSLAHMQYRLPSIPEHENYWGYVAYGGFLYYPVKLLSLLTQMDIPTSNEIMFYLQEYRRLELGNELIYYNALVPNVFYYYFDSGYLGAALFPAILGFAAGKGEKACKNPSFLRFLLWATCVYAIVYSPIDSVLWAFRYPTALIYCFLLKDAMYYRGTPAYKKWAQWMKAKLTKKEGKRVSCRRTEGDL
ncbi:MAG: oligosaccharide repeat unit polymerase [Oscillospiraceae bacterium]|nr:oligosaccharide repeat unit polymerase [Oscillospiraceae bacterium]